jgi:MSHA biogenesis protein MshI
MRIGLKQFLKQKIRKASAYNSVGIAFTADHVMLCALTLKDNKLTWELDASFSHQTWHKSLAEYVDKHHLRGTPCFFVLSSHWYRIHLIDKPSVNDEELISALQWPLKEVVGTDKELVYDFVDLPHQSSGQNKVMAVGVAKDEIARLSEVLFAADLDLQHISVEEIATTKLVGKRDEAVITLVQEHGEVVVLNIVKNNQLCFTRRLKGFENIGGYSENELEMGISESLCIQIQRSMDFFESQLRQAPIRDILVKLDSPHTQFLCQSIAEAMGVRCAPFEPEIKCNHELNFKMASFSCLGAAYTGSLSLLERKGKTKNTKSTKVLDDNAIATEASE